MFDIGWGEFMVVGVVALVVIGPKDLPKVMRTMGQATAKLRRMASEFQAQFQEAMREAEIDEIKKEVADLDAAARGIGPGFNPIQTIRDEIKGRGRGEGGSGAGLRPAGLAEPCRSAGPPPPRSRSRMKRLRSMLTFP